MSGQHEIKRDCKGKQRIYYNVSIPHNDRISVNGSATPAKFSEARDEPLFNGRPCDWTLSVVRFTIPTAYIPIQFFPVEYDSTNFTNINKSRYSITLEYLGVKYQEFLQWQTQDVSSKLPQQYTPGQTNREFLQNPIYQAYYGVFNYDHWVKIINNALKTCFDTNILPLLPAPPLGTEYKPPYFQYDGSNQLFSLYTQSIFLDTETNPINIYMNTFLANNFDTSFDQEYYGFLGNIDGGNVRFVIIDRGINTKFEDSTAPDGFIYQQKQDYNTLADLQAFTSIILRSVSLPINNEAISLQDRFGENQAVGSGSESIISDFEVDIGSGNLLKPYIHYVPTAEYRRITMNGNSPIQRIDVEILWKDNFDNLYPVAIGQHQIATIKMLFEEE